MRAIEIQLKEINENNKTELCINIDGFASDELDLTLKAIGSLIKSLEDCCEGTDKEYKEAVNLIIDGLRDVLKEKGYTFSINKFE